MTDTRGTTKALPLERLCSHIVDCPHSTPKWKDEGVVVLRNQNIRGGRLDLSSPSFTDEINFSKRIQRARPSFEDIVITREAPMGEVCMIPPGLRCCLGQRMVLLRPDHNSVAPRYLLYALQSRVVQDAIRLNGGTGSTVSNLRIPVLSSLSIPLPATRDEEEAIAEALSDADALIESLEQLIAKKRQIKQGAMQELLTGKRRLPGFTEPWSERAFESIAPLQRGFDLPTRMLSPGRYPVVYSNGILMHHGAFQVKGPGVVTGRSGTIGTVTFVEQDFWPHNTTLWVTSFRGNDPKFVYFLYAWICLERFATGSGVPTLNRNDVHAFRVLLPGTKDEQVAIANILSDMDAEISALESRLAKARAIKQGMMQELLTGRIRLVDASKVAV